jgi:AraC-like DNA-binding protein
VALALAEFRREAPAPAVGDVVDRIGLSARTFIRLFVTEVGLTPKLFCRVRRFQRALRLARGGQPAGWAGIALDCGYCDQAHLIRDFRALSGFTPTEFLRVWGRHLDYGARWTRSIFSKTPRSGRARMSCGHTPTIPRHQGASDR